MLGDRRLAAASETIRARVGADRVPAWTATMPAAAPKQLPATNRAAAAAVYLPSCLNRIFGNARGAPAGPTLPEALVTLSDRAGLPLWIPDDVAGHCCGVPWSSKGFQAGHAHMAARTAEALQRWSDGGRLPVVIDASSCTQGVISELEVDRVEVLDSVAWVHDHLLERLQVTRRFGAVAVHPTCACTQLGLSGKLAAIAQRLADEVVIPAGSGCCGMAGDRGWLHPELPASALRPVVDELRGKALRRLRLEQPDLRDRARAGDRAPVRLVRAGARTADAMNQSGSAPGRPVRQLPPPAGGPQHARLGVLALPALARRARALPTLPAPTGASRAPATSRRTLLRRQRIQDDEVAAVLGRSEAALRTARAR